LLWWRRNLWIRKFKKLNFELFSINQASQYYDSNFKFNKILNFKVFLTKDQSIRIFNQLLENDINTIINNKLFDYYATPGKLFKLIKLSEEYDLDIVNFDLNTTLKTLIKNKIYKKDKSIIEIIYSFIELYFRNNISIENISLVKSYNYFLKKINNTKIYNLDEETLFMEFEDKILNG